MTPVATASKLLRSYPSSSRFFTRSFATATPTIMDPWAITKDIGGEANVRRLETISRDFRSEPDEGRDARIAMLTSLLALPR
jgi:hypothetical protein